MVVRCCYISIKTSSSTGGDFSTINYPERKNLLIKVLAKVIHKTYTHTHDSPHMHRANGKMKAPFGTTNLHMFTGKTLVEMATFACATFARAGSVSFR